MELFKKRKIDTLKKQDKSYAGSVDVLIRPLVNLINSFDSVYTNSSCSGRICLIDIAPNRNKNKSSFEFVSHKKTEFPKLKKAIDAAKKSNLWLRLDSMILHISCKNLQSAKDLLRICQQSGFKRAGIISFGQRIIIEVFGTERIETLVAKKGENLIEDSYLLAILTVANDKLALNHEKIKRLEKELIKNKKLFLDNNHNN